MAWTIRSWSAERGVGEIASPHFGPIPFDDQANVERVPDFRVGEAVLVELDGDAPNFRVRVIRPTCQRQPEGTQWPAFEEVNSRFGDAWIEEQSSHSIQFWLGDCCERCTPNPVRIRFVGVTSVIGLGGDLDFGTPLFRLASRKEVEANSLAVSPSQRAFCVVASHGQGQDGPLIFIVARDAEVLKA